MLDYKDPESFFPADIPLNANIYYGGHIVVVKMAYDGSVLIAYYDKVESGESDWKISDFWHGRIGEDQDPTDFSNEVRREFNRLTMKGLEVSGELAWAAQYRRGKAENEARRMNRREAWLSFFIPWRKRTNYVVEDEAAEQDLRPAEEGRDSGGEGEAVGRGDAGTLS
jgi:hypothetical protein